MTESKSCALKKVMNIKDKLRLAIYAITLFISVFLLYCLFKAISLILLAVAEIMQKLQNIEDNTKN